MTFLFIAAFDLIVAIIIACVLIVCTRGTEGKDAS